jgi:hypothetical protein
MAPNTSVLYVWTPYVECYRKCIVGVNSEIPFGTLFLIFPGVPGTYNFEYSVHCSFLGVSLTHSVPETGPPPLSPLKVPNWILIIYNINIQCPKRCVWVNVDDGQCKEGHVYLISCHKKHLDYITVFPFRTTLSKIENCGRFVLQETWRVYVFPFAICQGLLYNDCLHYKVAFHFREPWTDNCILGKC